jgi:hypothetical protein
MSPSSEDTATRAFPHYLKKPEVILDSIWALADRSLHALGDPENAPMPPVQD